MIHVKYFLTGLLIAAGFASGGILAIWLHPWPLVSLLFVIMAGAIYMLGRSLCPEKAAAQPEGATNGQE